MSQNLRNFVQAAYTFDAVVRRTADDQWANDTPCDGWTALDLLEHQCAVVNGITQVASTGAMAMPTPPEDMSDPQGAWTATRDAMMEALDREGALDQAGPFWFKAPTVDDLIGIVMWDLVAHSWDLAQATDQAHCISDSLAQAALDVITPMSAMLADTQRTAPAIEVADDAPVLDRYLALTGRQPN